MYIRDYNKATTLYDTDAFIVDGSQETMYILVSDLYHALVGNKGFITDTDLQTRDYQTRKQVENYVESKGYITSIQADKMVTDKGYQTATQVEDIVEGYSYTTSMDVNRIIDAKGFVTSGVLDSYVTDDELENKNFQNEDEVIDLIKSNATKVDVDDAFSLDSINPLQNKIITKYLNSNIIYLGKVERLDNDLDSLAADLNIPNAKPYAVINVPLTGSFYLHRGGSHLILGMEYGNHQHGFQFSIGVDSAKRRGLSNGTWNAWVNTEEGTNPVQLASVNLSSGANITLGQSFRAFKAIVLLIYKGTIAGIQTGATYLVATYYIPVFDKSLWSPTINFTNGAITNMNWDNPTTLSITGSSTHSVVICGIP